MLRKRYNLISLVFIIGLHLIRNVELVSGDDNSTTTAKPEATSDGGSNEISEGSKQRGKLPNVSTKAPNDLGVAKDDKSKSDDGKSRASDDELESIQTTEKPSSDKGDSRASIDEFDYDDTSFASQPRASPIGDMKSLLDKGREAMEHVIKLYTLWDEFVRDFLGGEGEIPLPGLDGGDMPPPEDGAPSPGLDGGDMPPPGGVGGQSNGAQRGLASAAAKLAKSLKNFFVKPFKPRPSRPGTPDSPLLPPDWSGSEDI